MFRRKKKTYVFTSVSRMVEDEGIIPVMDGVILNHVLQGGKEPLVPAVVEGLQSALPNKLERILKRTKSGQYAYGVPESSLVQVNNDILKLKIDNYLEELTGDKITVDYLLTGSINNQHALYDMLIKQYGYDTSTNQLTELYTQYNTECFLHDAVIYYCNDTIENALEDDLLSPIGLPSTWGYTPQRTVDKSRPHTAYQIDESAGYDYVEVIYTFRSVEDFQQEDGFISRTEVTKERKPNETEEEYNKRPIEYDYLFKMKLNYLAYETSGNILDSMGNTSATVQPNVIDYNYIMVGYYDSLGIYQFFTYILGSRKVEELENIFNQTTSVGQFYPRFYARLHKQNLADDKFKDTEEYKTSTRLIRLLGSKYNVWVDELHKAVGDTGDVMQMYLQWAVPANTHDMVFLEYLFKYFEEMYYRTTEETTMLHIESGTDVSAKKGFNQEIKDKVHTQYVGCSKFTLLKNKGNKAPVGKYAFEMKIKIRPSGFRLNAIRQHCYYYQETENEYLEIVIDGLYSTEVVTGGYVTTATDSSENLLIPLDRMIKHKLSYKDKELLYAKAMHLVFNTHKVVKQKWYQTGIFKAILFVVSAIASVVTGGQSFTLANILLAIGKALAVSIAVNVVSQLLIKLGVPAKLVGIAVVALAVYAGYVSLSGTAGIMNMTAMSLMKVVNVAVKIYQNVNQYELKQIQKQMQDLEGEYKEKYKELKKAQELLGSNNVLNLDYLELTSAVPSDVFYELGETPEEFYNRTLSTNIGTQVYDMLTHFYDVQLQLPTLRDVLNQQSQRNESWTDMTF